jgi:predicted dehydrogenase
VIRVALVGCGHMGRHHARTIAAHPDCALVTTVDIRAPRAEAIAVEYGAQVADEAGDVDAVVIATPPSTHAALARHYLAEGRWVLVEKPLATSVDDVRTLPSGRLAIGHIERFNPAVRALGEVRPSFVEAVRVGPRSGRSADVNVVFDLMIHDLDLFLAWTTGGATVLAADGTEDMATVELRSEDGTEARFFSSRTSTRRERRVEIDADGTTWCLDLVAGTLSRDGGEPIAGPPPDALTCQWQSFVDRIRAEAPASPLWRGRGAVALAAEISKRIAGG